MFEYVDGLLATEIDTIYGLKADAVGPVRHLEATTAGPVKVAYGWSPSKRVLAVRPGCLGEHDGHDLLADDEFAAAVVPETIHRAVARLRTLDPDAAGEIAGGPSFVFPAATVAQPAIGLPVHVSDEAGIVQARAFIRPSNWEDDEWAALIAGHLGPWAMAVTGNESVSICHTPTSRERTAEAGIWTRPDYRGQGLAAPVVRAWWECERSRRDIVFYSTDRNNQASQAVAAKLGLTPVGWIWTVR